MKDKLTLAREKINEIDLEMARLFTERLMAAEAVAEHKREHGLPICDPQREQELIKRTSDTISEEVYRGYYQIFQQNVMDLSKSYQERLLKGIKIAYCGTEGAYAHIATMKLFPTAKKVGYGSFDAAYEAVVKGECDLALLPIENSSNGDVGQVTDLMFSGPLYINTVTELAISHDLLVVPGAKREDIKTIISHTQALGQCHEYIKNHGYDEIEYPNTALAAKHVKEQNDKSIAAIASKEAAEIFGLEVIDTNVNESRSNTTRFAVFSRSENKNFGSNKSVHTILLFTVRNEAGALAKAIEIIGQHGYNMGALRSRPMKELLWQYYFYVEIEGNLNTDNGKAMLKELDEYCDKLKVVGTYKKM